MELTEKTLDVLRNYASINSSIIIESGNVVRTTSPTKQVLSKSKLDDEFTNTFGIYDLNELLRTINLVDAPRLFFEDKYMSINDGSGRSRIKYFYCETDILHEHIRNIVKSDHDSMIVMPECEVKFTLDSKTLSQIKKAAAILGHSIFAVSAKDGIMNLSVQDLESKSSNSFTMDVDGEFQNEEFSFHFKIENLKMIDGDYDVGISSRKISHFVNKESNIEYWVACEKSSTYGG